MVVSNIWWKDKWLRQKITSKSPSCRKKHDNLPLFSSRGVLIWKYHKNQNMLFTWATNPRCHEWMAIFNASSRGLKSTQILALKSYLWSQLWGLLTHLIQLSISSILQIYNMSPLKYKIIWLRKCQETNPTSSNIQIWAILLNLWCIFLLHL